MTTRERVLIWGMAVAVLWGGVTIGLGMMRKNLGTSGNDEKKEEVRAFADVQRAQVAPFRLSAQEKLVLDNAEASWGKSPFVNRVSAPRAVEERIHEFDYTGFVQIGKHQFAILNGHEYRESEPVDFSDFIVESIQQDQVVLVSESGGRRLTIALKTSNDQRETP